MKYDFQAIEKKWQARWEEEKPFAAIEWIKQEPARFHLPF